MSAARARCSGILARIVTRIPRALPLLLLATACGRAPQETPPAAAQVFLLNLPPEQVALDGAWGFDLQTAEGELEIGGRVCAGEYRRTLVMARDAGLAFRGAIRPRSRLVTAIGFETIHPAPAPRFSLEVVARGPDGAERKLHEELVTPPGKEEERVWRPLELDLTGLEQSDLVLYTRALEREPPQPALLPGWANPRVVSADVTFPVRADGEQCVVVFLIDTLRADRLGLYGHERDTAPRIAELAAEALVFTRALSTSSWTKPAVGSLMTSLLPSQHAAEDYLDRLGGGERTLAQVLKEHGYRTAAVGANVWVFEPKFDMLGGFDERIFVVDRDASNKVRSDQVVDEAIDWLERADERPFFLYVHTLDPHAPYDPRGADRTRFQEGTYAGPLTGRLDGPGAHEGLRPKQVSAEDIAFLRALYDGEIASNDAQVGRLVDRLRALGLWEECTFVVTADHGEEFLDHGAFGHGRSLHQEQVWIPLVVKPPRSAGLAPRRVEAPVSLLDVAPTVCELAGIPAPESFLGRGLESLALDPERFAEDALLSELHFQGRKITSIRLGDWKYTAIDAPFQGEALYDLGRDPGERQNLASTADAALLARFRALLEANRARAAADAGIHVRVTSDGPSCTLELEIRSSGAAPDFRVQDGEHEVDSFRVSDGTVAITLEVGGNDREDRVVLHPRGGELSMTVRRAGKELARERILLGAAGRHPDAASITLVPADLLAAEPAPPAPDGDAWCQVWSLTGEEVVLDPDELEALRELGY